MKRNRIKIKYSVLVELVKSIYDEDCVIEEALKEGEIVIVDDNTGKVIGTITFGKQGPQATYSGF